jgi:hypothetical protein
LEVFIIDNQLSQELPEKTSNTLLVEKPKNYAIGRLIIILLGITLSVNSIATAGIALQRIFGCVCWYCFPYTDLMMVGVITLASLAFYYGVWWSKIILIFVAIANTFNWGLYLYLTSVLMPAEWAYAIFQFLLGLVIFYILFVNNSAFNIQNSTLIKFCVGVRHLPCLTLGTRNRCRG